MLSLFPPPPLSYLLMPHVWHPRLVHARLLLGCLLLGRQAIALAVLHCIEAEKLTVEGTRAQLSGRAQLTSRSRSAMCT